MPIINKTKNQKPNTDLDKVNDAPPSVPSPSPLPPPNKQVILVIFLCIFCIPLLVYYFNAPGEIGDAPPPLEPTENKMYKNLAVNILMDINSHQRYFKEYEAYESSFRTAQSNNYSEDVVMQLKSDADKAKRGSETALEQLKFNLKQIIQNYKENQAGVLRSVDSLLAEERNETNKLLLQRLKEVLPPAAAKPDLPKELLDQLMSM